MQQKELWVFGYGSLLWRPGFEYAEQRLATLEGFNRSFCMRSIHYRGTVESPGLVLALDPEHQAQCQGVGFRVPANATTETLKYLRDRELVSAAYTEQWHRITFRDGGSAEAVCYVIDRNHDQYCGALSLSEQAEIISTAVGGAGPNTDYLFNTVSHLAELGIADPDLEELASIVASLSS